MPERSFIRRVARAGQAPASRFFDPRFQVVLDRLDALVGSVDATRRHAEDAARGLALRERDLADRAMALESRVDRVAAVAEAAALRAGRAGSGEDDGEAVGLAIGAALAGRGPSARVAVIGPGADARVARLRAAGFREVTVAPAEGVIDASAVVCAGGAEHLRSRVREGTLLVSIGPGEPGFGWEVSSSVPAVTIAEAR